MTEPQPAAPPEAPVAGTLLSNPQLFELFVTKVVQQVDTHMQERQSRSVQRISIAAGIFTAIFTLIATGIFTYFQTVIEKQRIQIEDQIGKDVALMIDKQIERMAELDARSTAFFTSESLYAEFVMAASVLDVKEKAGIDDILSMYELLRRVAKVDSLREKPNLPQLLAKVVDILNGFKDEGVDVYLDEIEPLYRDELKSNRSGTETMLHHYARELLNVADAPADWTPEMLERFDTYAKSSNFHNDQDTALAMRMLIEFVQSGGKENSANQAMIAMADAMTDDQKEYIRKMINNYADDKRRPVQSERCKMFRELYGERLGLQASQ